MEQEHEPQATTWDDEMSDLHEYLLLLGILVATVTCTAGLDPPGGLWQENSRGAGDHILRDTRRVGYLLFYLFNSSAFVGSLVLVYVLLMARKNKQQHFPKVVMLAVDLVLLLLSFVAGSCRGLRMAAFASAHCAAIVAAVFFAVALCKRMSLPGGESAADEARRKRLRRFVVLLAIFATAVTYTASLAPPGGFWESAAGRHHHHQQRAAGDPILIGRDPVRFLVFFAANTTAFATSVAILMLLPFVRLTKKVLLLCMYPCTMLVMLGLGAAYVASVWAHSKADTIIAACLIFCVAVYVVFHQVWHDDAPQAAGPAAEDKARELILLLAAMVVTVTYQAGLQPPGGVWRDGSAAGGLILLATNPRRYKVFFFGNSAAFVTSIAVVIMVQSRSLAGSQHALEAAVILDVLGLMGAYAAGTVAPPPPSCRLDAWAGYYIVALAAAISLCLVASLVRHKLYSLAMAQQDPTPPPTSRRGRQRLERMRDVLMCLATMAITITYQAGLTPPGKFWMEAADEHGAAGGPVLADTDPQRYHFFFFFNGTSFMVSAAVILLLVSRDLHSTGRMYWGALFLCVFCVLIFLMATYIAGALRSLPRPAYTAVFAIPLLLFFCRANATVIHMFKGWFSDDNSGNDDDVQDQEPQSQRVLVLYATRKTKEYLVGVSILAATITYQAGLVPPGGIWPADGDNGHTAGSPVLGDMDGHRYRAFSYCNSASFVASIVVNVLLLLDAILDDDDGDGNGEHGGRRTSFFSLSIPATRAVLLIDVLCLLMAYATGSSRDWGTWVYVVAMAAAMLVYLAIYVMLVPRRSLPAPAAARPRTAITAPSAGHQLPVVRLQLSQSV